MSQRLLNARACVTFTLQWTSQAALEHRFVGGVCILGVSVISEHPRRSMFGSEKASKSAVGVGEEQVWQLSRFWIQVCL